MDTTETNIKMCEKAEEIQKDHKWEYGDCFIQVYANGEQAELQFMSDELDDPFYGDYPDFEGNKYAIWLPTQSQLQEMVKLNKNEYSYHLKKSEAHRLLFEFYHFCIEEIGYSLGNVINATSDTRQFTSMEQLWLAFLLAEKYGKYWDGSDWVKEE